MEPSPNKVPKHIGFIMDGNRRFAKKLMMKPWKGHEWGKEKLRKVLDWCKELGIEETTFYAFSIQNFDRPKKEFDYLMDIFRDASDEIINDPKLYGDEVRINFIGRIHLFPKDLYEKMKKVMELTKNNKKYIVNFAVAYGGREEIIDAVRKIGKKIKQGKLKVEDINEEIFENELYTPDEPDMVIRTGGEIRTSNFMPWQSNYSELLFIEKMWPELEKEDVVKCVQEYSDRHRRFGK